MNIDYFLDSYSVTQSLFGLSAGRSIAFDDIPWVIHTGGVNPGAEDYFTWQVSLSDISDRTTAPIIDMLSYDDHWAIDLTPGQPQDGMFSLAGSGIIVLGTDDWTREFGYSTTVDGTFSYNGSDAITLGGTWTYRAGLDGQTGTQQGPPVVVGGPPVASVPEPGPLLPIAIGLVAIWRKFS